MFILFLAMISKPSSSTSPSGRIPVVSPSISVYSTTLCRARSSKSAVYTRLSKTQSRRFKIGVAKHVLVWSQPCVMVAFQAEIWRRISISSMEGGCPDQRVTRRHGGLWSNSILVYGRVRSQASWHTHAREQEKRIKGRIAKQLIKNSIGQSATEPSKDGCG
jgi:hypothetical protein